MSMKDIRAVITQYQKSNTAKALWQLVSTLGAYALVWVGIYYSLEISLWLMIPLVLLGAGLLIRIFIIFHDCCHGSFFSSKSANEFCGYLTGILAFTPFHYWKWQHLIHHRTSGNLDKRGTGDIWTMTVQEYLDSPRLQRIYYRLARNPIVLFAIAPFLLFVVWHRFCFMNGEKNERRSVWITNFGLLGMAVGMASVFGIVPYLLLQTAIMVTAGSMGIWMFYVQHQFEGVYWQRNENWNYVQAAIQGSSFYKLPKVLQWFSGNIGFHHVHHLSPQIPNYYLEKCHNSTPALKEVKALTLISSFKSLQYRLWDEASEKLVSFRHISKLRQSK